jgi:SAM-dependent methyltransferase
VTSSAVSRIYPPLYDGWWIERYQAVKGPDARITATEMTAFTELFETEFCDVSPTAIRHLDVGTCAGRYLHWGLRQGFELICGIDRAPASAEFCARTIKDARVHVYCADVLSAVDLNETVHPHAPFQLVTMMLGTINHFDVSQQADVLRSFRRLLRADGKVVISAWRPDCCALSLYAEPERRFLEASPVDERHLARLTEASGLRTVRTASTPWHTLTLLSVG